MNKELIINIDNELFETGSKKDYSGEVLIDSFSSKYDEYVCLNPTTYNLTLTNTGDSYFLSGSAKVDVQTKCSRCLEFFKFQLNTNIENLFITQSMVNKKEPFDSLDVHIIDNKINAKKIIVSNFLLEVPIMPICNDDCRGLCQYCGCNLNKVKCRCEEDRKITNSQFAELKNYKFEG